MAQAVQGVKVLLWGGGSQARIIHQMIGDLGLGSVAGVFDDSLRGPGFEGPTAWATEAVGLEALLAQATHFVACIGNEHGYARVRVSEALAARGLQPLTVAHPRAFVEPGSRLGQGCQLMPGALVHKFCRVGDYSVLNTACSVDHECELGRGVHVMGAAALAGRVRVGDYASIGTNATVLPGLSIGEGAIVGAGAVVTQDVPAWAVVAGNPARALRQASPRLDPSIKLLERA